MGHYAAIAKLNTSENTYHSMVTSSIRRIEMPSWRLLIVTVVLFLTSYWFFQKGILVPDAVFFAIAGVIMLILSFKA